MMQGERYKLLKMEERLHKRVVGQDEAVRRWPTPSAVPGQAFSDPNRPDRSFLFLGPHGVGKTELCKALAEFMFDNEEHLIRIDMSEFMEKHSAARLIGRLPATSATELRRLPDRGGAPQALQRHPLSTRRKGPSGRVTCCCRCGRWAHDRRPGPHRGFQQYGDLLLLFGLGSQMIQQMAGDDYGMVKMAVMAEVKTDFRPEFINGIDEVVLSHSLDEQHIAGIAKIQLGYILEAPGPDGNGHRGGRQRPAELARPASRSSVRRPGPLSGHPAADRKPPAKSILEGRFAAKDVIRGDLRQRHDAVRQGLSFAPMPGASAGGGGLTVKSSNEESGSFSGPAFFAPGTYFKQPGGRVRRFRWPPRPGLVFSYSASSTRPG